MKERDLIKSFPPLVQTELEEIQKLILKEIPGTCMIILYGSYGRGDYVFWDERVEFDIHTIFQSDLDIMVLTSKGEPWKQESKAQDRVNKRYDKNMLRRQQPMAQVVVENIHVLNKALEEKRYFYTDAVNDGILLYDNGKFTLNEPRELSYREIKEIAQEEFDDYFPYASGLLGYGGREEDGLYKLGAFLFHQAAERFYYCMTLVFTNYKPKCHSLEKLAGMTKSFTGELAGVFPVNTPEEVVAYDLLCRAYIESRYNRFYQVNREQYQYMLTHLREMKDLVYKLCKAQLAYYEEKAREEEHISGMMAAERSQPYGEDS